MLYFELKFLHIVFACVLICLAVWSVAPIFMQSTSDEPAVKCLIKRNLLGTFPVGFVVMLLGMSVLSVEPQGWSSHYAQNVVFGFIGLCVAWFAVIGVLCASYNRVFRAKYILLGAVMVSFLLLFSYLLYHMVNFH